MSRTTTAAIVLAALGGFALVAGVKAPSPAGAATPAPAPAPLVPDTCNPPETGITLPPGFCATVFADNLGHTRHMAIAADGTVYVNSWSGRYYRNFPPVTGAFLVALKDSDGDGHADQILRFGPTTGQGNAGGDGIALWRGGLYVETNDSIVRYPVAPGRLEPTGPAEVVVKGMPLDGNHPMHPFAIDAQGNLFVNMGSPSNTCQEQDRQPLSKGIDPCLQLATHAGIWKYRADAREQPFSAAERWATGIRNTGGITFDAAGRIYAVQHGRDQLSQNWPALYTTEQGVELPAEELIAPAAGDDFGWPACYYDAPKGKLVLAPEYGGNGGKAVGRCAGKKGPVAAFPAHWAPNDVLAWHPSATSAGFPGAYDNGVFIAFHGSWNRAPAPQAGYQVVFQPLRNGAKAGPWIRFADGFAGATREPGRAAHRPAGLAQGPDGALYIADDVRGTIWRVTYRGSPDAPLAPAPEATPTPVVAAPVARAAPLPDGANAADVDTGRRIFLGELKGGTCSGCHGSDGRGSSAGPALVGPTWLWADGTPASFAKVIRNGVPQPKNAGGPMPARGGADLTDEDIRKVAAYVWTLGHPAR
ncbi:glucose/sorbosone dehydrogenase-like protein [Novosphingobium nitrogenifigens DSM 19370]|uniref:Glucose/sorbosone dehydrogenase-like protein n=1 Tax=Novosphingobium nitrogenifigens DSM 19370 TaxID=983920 RepID=F1Z3L6_9SPHN|nr:c-type cytochrome [Novosphingobium nitrogenifigens]EGD60830.1 glucose/sorbosone dehydrogenase-like protein [Novosphingobium nitrogenifigens DSM 19370]